MNCDFIANEMRGYNCAGQARVLANGRMKILRPGSMKKRGLKVLINIILNSMS